MYNVYILALLALAQAAIGLPTTLQFTATNTNLTCVTLKKLSDGSVRILSGGEQRPWTHAVKFNHQTYSNAHGFHYKFADGNLAAPRQPYWHKVKLLLDQLDSPDTADWLVWVDDDIVFTHIESDNLQRAFNQMVEENKALAVTEDAGPFSRLNTGIIIVRNSESGRRLVDELWKRGNGKLGTLSQSRCLHEQEALESMANSYFLPWAKMILILPQRKGTFDMNTFNRESHYDPCRGQRQSYHSDRAEARWKVGDFTCHCSGLHSKLRQQKLWECLETAHPFDSHEIPEIIDTLDSPCGTAAGNL